MWSRMGRSPAPGVMRKGLIGFCNAFHGLFQNASFSDLGVGWVKAGVCLGGKSARISSY